MLPKSAPSNHIADLRRALIVNGYVPVPVDGKRPRVPGWQDLAGDASQVDSLIKQHPDHLNTGLLTGSVVAIDVDVLDPDLAHRIQDLIAALPGAEAALCRVGKAPKSLFVFRASTTGKKKVTQKYVVAGQPAQVEILGMGQQFVGFGTHPETLKPYEWVGDSPLDISFSDLPEITPETIDQFLVDAQALLSSAGTPMHSPKAPQAVYASSSGSTAWERVNAAAFANLDAWVPRIGLYGLKRYGDGYLAVASFRQSKRAGLAESARQPALEFQAVGICDHGDGDQGYSPVSMVAECLSKKPAESLLWLCDALGIRPADIGWEIASTETPLVVRNLAAALVAANDNAPQSIAELAEAPSDGLPVRLCHPPGVVGDIVDFVLGSARFPSAPLALSAALSLMAALIGRRYKSPTGLRSNVYIVTLAESGFGKEHSLSAVRHLAGATQAGSRFSEKFIADSPPKSAEGLATRLRADPSIVIQVDELGLKLRTWVGRKGSSVGEGIVTALLELTGKASSSWGGGDRSAGKVESIIKPCVSIQAVSTAHTFWDALESGDAASGFLPRLILIDAGTVRPVKQRSLRYDVETPPSGLVNAIEVIAGRNIGGNLLGIGATGTVNPGAVISASYDQPSTADFFENFDDRIVGEAATTTPVHRALLTRAAATAGQLALIVAVGVNPSEPVITREIMEWACDVAEHSLRHMMRGAEAHIADSDKQREYKKVRGYIERAGDKGITRTNIIKRVNGSIDSQRLAAILGQLRDAGDIVDAEMTSTSGQKLRRFWAIDHLPKSAEKVG